MARLIQCKGYIDAKYYWAIDIGNNVILRVSSNSYYKENVNNLKYPSTDDEYNIAHKLDDDKQKEIFIELINKMNA